MDSSGDEKDIPKVIHRRGVLLGLVSALAAPAIVHAGNLMPIKVLKPDGIIYTVCGVDQFGQMMTETISIPYVPSSPVEKIVWVAERTKLRSVTSVFIQESNLDRIEWQSTPGSAISVVF